MPTISRTVPAFRPTPSRRAVLPPTSGSPGNREQLSNGSKGSDVVDLQQKLAASGFNPGPVDGDFGQQTRAAVVRFQQANGLEVDGVVGPKTWAKLDGDSFTPAPARPVNPAGPVGSDQRARILAVAQGEVGNVERTNHNDGQVAKYPAYFGRGNEAYCADFVSWVMQQTGGSMNDPYCPSVRNELIATGNWKGRTNPQAGDMVLFDWDHDGTADHIGLVKSVNANGTLTTIEGNTAGPHGREGVWERTRGWDTVLGFGNPM